MQVSKNISFVMDFRQKFIQIFKFKLDRQKRSPAPGYDDHYSNFFADRYSDLDSVEDNNEYKSENSESSEGDEEVDSSEDFNGRKLP
jgi:hypothetical protein